jgi:hypothetical protein
MGLQVGAGYFGDATLMSSTPNVDIIQPYKPADYSTAVTFAAYKFSFANQSACSVLINDATDAIFLDSDQGFTIGYEDAPIFSFKIVEAGITYNCVGAYI